MPDRKKFISALWIASAIALLATVVVASPIRTSGFVAVSSLSDCVCVNFALLPHQDTCPGGTTVLEAVFEEDEDFSSEFEGQEQADARAEPGSASSLPSTIHKLPDRDRAISRLTLATYPLRC